VDHPDRQPEILVVDGALEHAVPQRDRFGPDPLQPELGERGPQVPRPLQRGTGQIMTGKTQERGIDIGHSPDLSAWFQ
jgi:hypothetical protein